MQIALEEQTRKTSPWVHRVWDLQEACGDRDPDALVMEGGHPISSIPVRSPCLPQSAQKCYQMNE